MYNTLTGERAVYKNKPEIAKLLKRTMSKKNLNAIIVKAGMLNQKGLDGFLKEARNKQMINWFEHSKTGKNQRKPVSIPAILNLHRDRKIMALDPERNPGEDIKNVLHKINIHINCYERKHRGGPEFTDAYRQFLYPYALPAYHELRVSRIRRFLDQIKDLQSFRLSILGGNIFQHTEFDDLIVYLGRLPVKKEFGVSYRDITDGGLDLLKEKSPENTTIRVFTESKFQKDEFLKCVDRVRKSGISADFQFTVQDEADLDRLGEVYILLDEDGFSVKPFFNGRNQNFFKENVFIEEADLSDPVVSKKDIYAQSVMNTNSFGVLTILSTGAVHANLNETRAGTIDCEIHDILLAVMSRGDGWFRVRENVPPCKSCVYNHVCPPVSNYEYALSRNNLCNIYGDGHGG
jgi:pseudo-rSAM protein